MSEGLVSIPIIPEPWLRHGEILDGKFRIGEILGRGGMGVVVAAHHLDLDEAVALKFLVTDTTESTTAKERLLREARATARLRSPHVTRVFDVGRTLGVPYIVMERLRGADLASLLRSRGRFPVGEAVRYVLDVCEPLEEAHRQGIVHRDLKPHNIFLARTPNGGSIVKLLDFGISRASTSDLDLTREDELLGTPHFMSPEQYQESRAAGPASDIYSLGACLHYLLAGRPPFSGRDLVSLAVEVISVSPPLLDSIRGDVPHELALVVHRCLAKSPRDRFASAAALREALAPFAVLAAPSAHLGDETIMAMQEGLLAKEELADVERHVADCAECRALVASAAPASSRTITEGATRTSADATLPDATPTRTDTQITPPDTMPLPLPAPSAPAREVEPPPRVVTPSAPSATKQLGRIAAGLAVLAVLALAIVVLRGGDAPAATAVDKATKVSPTPSPSQAASPALTTTETPAPVVAAAVSSPTPRALPRAQHRTRVPASAPVASSRAPMPGEIPDQR